MPGFLIFEELGIDPDMPGAGLAKTGLAMVPGSWMLHGLGGEYNVNVDPIAEINATLDGGGHLGSMASSAEGAADAAASGDVGGAVGGALGVVTEFWEAYKGWIPVVSVSQNIPGEAEENEFQMRQLMESKNGQSGGSNDVVTDFDRRKVGRDTMSVEVHLDASFPKLLEAALDEDGGTLFKSADVHLCTVASIDVRALTFGADNPAAALIQALVSAYMFNIIPYLTIGMRDVRIASVDYNLQGDADGVIPSAQVQLKFKKVTWTYHVINNSNMNLFNVEYTYEVGTRSAPAEFSLGNLLNPFG